jgi:Putative prokaryotic signal transducing protein
MAYCPQCGTEYAEGSPECMDCHVPLRPGAPPSAGDSEDTPKHNVKLVTAHVFSGSTAAMDAEMAKNWLESEGIPSVLSGEYSARLVPVLDCPLLVQEEDLEEATRLLKEYLESDTTLPDDEPA